jgi:7-keto-8-aminopelargonate synthetase-like enzyme
LKLDQKLFSFDKDQNLNFMQKQISIYDTIDQIITSGVKNEILHLSTEDSNLIENIITLNGKSIINFGSCSYLGLEFENQLIESSIDAIKRYGTQFSSSRAYVSLGLYDELESLFERIFGYPSVVTPTTTLGHLSALPVLIGSKDAILIDHQVHTSVQTAANTVKAKGVFCELIRHNRVDLIEEKIIELKQKHNQIWYLADGVYSMYGDFAPLKELESLMNKYPEFRVYIDDAHGMSWKGKNGKGYVLSEIDLHPQMVLATSLAKGFATGGAVLVFPSKEMARKVRTCGSTLITSGPMQPATLGAAIASAKLHLSPEFEDYQQELEDNIRYCHLMLKKYELPDVSEEKSPIFFVGVSLPKIANTILRRMLKRGYLLNLGTFPAVPIKNTGIRFTITRLHTFEQIESMISSLKQEFTKALQEEDFSIEKIYSAFKIKSDLQEQLKSEKNFSDLTLRHAKSIREINKEEWDTVHGQQGSFDFNGLAFLEDIFKNQESLPENNWDFDYITILDKSNQVVLSTFFTTTISKEDMLSPASVSLEIEKQRILDPYFMTSKVLMMGCMISEGNHLFLDKNNKNWQQAVEMMFDVISKWQTERGIQNTILRDFAKGDEAFDNTFLQNAFIRIPMPNFHDIKNFEWNGIENYLSKKSKNTKDYWKRYILRNESKFEADWSKRNSKQNLKKYYEMYQAVKNKNLEINTFDLPFEFFEKLIENPNWDILELYYKNETNNTLELAAVSFNYLGECYCPMIIGINYAYKDLMPYRQAAYKVLQRAGTLDKKTIKFGFGASIEKKYWGAESIETYAYFQSKDNFAIEYLMNYSSNSYKIENKKIS